MQDLEVASGGHAAVAGMFVALVIAPNNCSNCCFVGSADDGVIALVAMKRGCIGVDVPGVLGVGMALGGEGGCGGPGRRWKS
jgi:hypothetical protein